jgi:hypothetical protein
MESEARGIDSTLQPDVVFDVQESLHLDRSAGKPRDMRPKRSRRPQGRNGSALLVLLDPVGKLGPLDLYPVAAGKGSQILGSHRGIRPCPSGPCKVAQKTSRSGREAFLPRIPEHRRILELAQEPAATTN